ncbi:MAG: helix-turn-helix domain-containing protein [Brachybacterium sp.]|uniref:helix-turn-helix domain-containing protein n=1 Tax=Brachybacterium sp. TaxID=1891286 RepID=UPI003F8E7343
MGTTPDSDVTETLDAIGPRLRALRQARELTLTEVADTTGLSISILSRVETGHRQPTLDVLIPLARTYQVALDRLVAAPATGDPRVHLEPYRHARGGVVESAQVLCRYFAGSGSRARAS